MHFCKQCGSRTTKEIVNNKIIFQCNCQLIIDGGPNDSLMYEEFIETNESNLKHAVFLENAPFDPAANVIHMDCPKCSLNFMTMVRIGVNQITMYACSCGYSATHEEYSRSLSKKT